jgi:hypothetical protein
MTYVYDDMSRIRSKVASDGYVYDDMSRIRGKIESASLRVDQRYSCSYRPKLP